MYMLIFEVELSKCTVARYCKFSMFNVNCMAIVFLSAILCKCLRKVLPPIFEFPQFSRRFLYE